MIDRIESAMTDIDAIIEGLSEAQKDGIRGAFGPWLGCRASTVSALTRKGLAGVVSCGQPYRYHLNKKGQAVRARLLGDK